MPRVLRVGVWTSGAKFDVKHRPTPPIKQVADSDIPLQVKSTRVTFKQAGEILALVPHSSSVLASPITESDICALGPAFPCPTVEAGQALRPFPPRDDITRRETSPREPRSKRTVTSVTGLASTRFPSSHPHKSRSWTSHFANLAAPSERSKRREGTGYSQGRVANAVLLCGAPCFPAPWPSPSPRMISGSCASPERQEALRTLSTGSLG